MGIYTGRSGVAIRRIDAGVHFQRVYKLLARNAGGGRGDLRGRAGTVRGAENLARSAARKTGAGAPGPPVHPARGFAGLGKLFLASAGSPAGVFI